MTVSVIHQPHDKFLKLSFGEPRVAQEFFSEHLPKSILQVIDLTTLKRENQSFIDENFKNNEADIIYSVQVAQARAYLYLLCEHHSTIDHWIAFRLWVYRIRLMESHLKQHPGQPLPLVYPLVIYTGQSLWTGSLNVFELFGDQQALAEEWFFKPFQLLDLPREDDDIRRRQWCGLVEFALKYKQDHDFKQFLKILLPWIGAIEQSGSPGFSLGKIVLKYTLDGVEARGFEVFKESVHEYLSPPLREEIMTLAQELREEGFHQGEAAVITRLLTRRFHQIPMAYLAKIEQADAEILLSWSDKILDARSIEEIFE